MSAELPITGAHELMVAFARLVSAVDVVPTSDTFGSATLDGVAVAWTIYWIYHLPLLASNKSVTYGELPLPGVF